MGVTPGGRPSAPQVPTPFGAASATTPVLQADTLGAWANVDSMSVTVAVSATGIIECHASVRFSWGTGSWVHAEFSYLVDGTTRGLILGQAEDTGPGANNRIQTANLTDVFTGLAPGNHTITLQWNNDNVGQRINVLDRRMVVRGVAS